MNVFSDQINTRSLPTKRRIREALAIPADSKSEMNALSKALKTLGLDGLPRGRKGE